jgi:hypothetical protein
MVSGSTSDYSTKELTMPDEQRIKALVEEIASIRTGDDWRDMLRAGDQNRAREILKAESSADELRKLGVQALPYLIEKVGLGAYMVKGLLIQLGEQAEEQVSLLLEHPDPAVQKEARSILKTIAWNRENF